MDIKKLIGNNVLEVPEDLKPVLVALETGELKSLMIVGEYQDGHIATSWHFGMNGGHTNAFSMLGALEALKFELLHMVALDDEEDEDE